MRRSIACFLIIGLSGAGAAFARSPVSQQQLPAYVQPVTPPMVVAAQPPVMETNLGGGFIQFVFGSHAPAPQEPPVPPPAMAYVPSAPPAPPGYIGVVPATISVEPRAMLPDGMDPRFQRRELDFRGKQAPGTIIVDTPDFFLYFVEPGGKAIRYGIGVGRPGFTWAGTYKVSAKKEWPDWVPPAEMLARQPELPRFMAGGPNNPLGARAIYIGSTLYRIHGSNEPWTIGHQVSSGCIRMRNQDVIDLYNRVTIGATVEVL